MAASLGKFLFQLVSHQAPLDARRVIPTGKPFDANYLVKKLAIQDGI
jgi:hypothetical protein